MHLCYSHMTLVCNYAATHSKECHLRVQLVAKMSKAGMEMNRVDLVGRRLIKKNTIDKYWFCCCHSEKRIFLNCKKYGGGWAGFGTGSSFLMDFNLLSHFKLSSRLQIVTYILYSIVYGATCTPTFCAHVIVSNLL